MLWSAQRPLASVADKRELAERTGARAVDMEAASVAAIALHTGLPFVAVKAICDPASRELPASIVRRSTEPPPDSRCACLSAIAFGGPAAWRATRVAGAGFRACAPFTCDRSRTRRMSTRVLVSGANGFVGSAVVRALLRHGYTVRALVRASSDTRNLDGVDAEIVHGDLLDPPSLKHALQDCEGLFHVAADYRLWARDPTRIRMNNVRGTRNILAAANRSDVSRIVHTSSVATLGLHDDGTPADEDTASRYADMIGEYKRSKYLAEKMARRQAHAGHDIVIVNPAAPVGPRDSKPTPTGRMILDAARGSMPAFVDTGLCVVHVDDVAEGHVLAYERGQSGRRYILGGDNMSLKAILAEVAHLKGGAHPG